ncbi:MAG: hypothetical protein Q8L57_01145 [bacterium]|nr:hypothetical protein [bacterium]
MPPSLTIEVRQMKKIILAILVIALGFLLATWGILDLKKTERKNAVLDLIQRNEKETALKLAESLDKNSAADYFLAGFAWLMAGDIAKTEEIMAEIIVNQKTPDFWRVRALYNLACLQILKFMAGGFQNQSFLKNAVFYYQESLRISPDFWPSKYNLERLIQEKPGQEKQKEEQGEPDEKNREQRQEKSQPGLNPPLSGLP